MIIANWKINEKGKQPGWAAIVPIYNQYILCKIVGVNPWWIVIVLCSSVIAGIPVIGPLVSAAASIYFLILLNVSLARSFGKEDSFAIGLILLPIVFYPMIAFGKNEYVGAKPMNDIVFKKISSTNNGSSNTNQTVDNNNSTDNNVSTETVQPETKFCPNCGAKVEQGAKFCASCGGEIK